MKNSLGEVERYYAQKLRQAPHVISCYAAGVRLIGLNDRQLEQELRRMQKAAKNQDSPYAKPLPFVSMTKYKDKKRKKSGKTAKDSQDKDALSSKSQDDESKQGSTEEKLNTEQKEDQIKVRNYIS